MLTYYLLGLLTIPALVLLGALVYAAAVIWADRQDGRRH